MVKREVGMRKTFIEEKDRRKVIKLAPWAAKAIKVDGGYMVFESVEDWKIWSRQK